MRRSPVTLTQAPDGSIAVDPVAPSSSPAISPDQGGPLERIRELAGTLGPAGVAGAVLVFWCGRELLKRNDSCT
jgi:pyruvate-formate lyase